MPLYFVFLTIRRQPRSTLFPYTTLFRSTITLVSAAFFMITVAYAARGQRLPVKNSRPFSQEMQQLELANDAQLTDVLSPQDRKSTRLNSSHTVISYAVFCLKKKKTTRLC